MLVKQDVEQRSKTPQPLKFIAFDEHGANAARWVRQDLAVVVQDAHRCIEIVGVARSRSPAKPDVVLILTVRKGCEREHDVSSHRREPNIHGANQLFHVCHSVSGM